MVRDCELLRTEMVRRRVLYPVNSIFSLPSMSQGNAVPALCIGSCFVCLLTSAIFNGLKMMCALCIYSSILNANSGEWGEVGEE